MNHFTTDLVQALVTKQEVTEVFALIWNLP
ncbi:hypothetical protein J2W91_004588 [Paenibacillus amylolyticus]|uniref:Uncharacterized protein n=1 Tax=Paenibacillus amylolyticus TaxID=1451 RepID=A0AAP5LNU0_PAEAM|nr:hypothetical protein [Paenibacillus amylolyticus]